jgi:hypothetical protein
MPKIKSRKVISGKNDEKIMELYNLYPNMWQRIAQFFVGINGN